MQWGEANPCQTRCSRCSLPPQPPQQAQRAIIVPAPVLRLNQVIMLPAIRALAARRAPLYVSSYSSGGGSSVKFTMQRKLPFGSKLAVVGSKPALGAWCAPPHGLVASPGGGQHIHNARCCMPTGTPAPRCRSSGRTVTCGSPRPRCRPGARRGRRGTAASPLRPRSTPPPPQPLTPAHSRSEELEYKYVVVADGKEGAAVAEGQPCENLQLVVPEGVKGQVLVLDDW